MDAELRSAAAVQERVLRSAARTRTARPSSIMDGTSDQAASNWGNVYIAGRPEQRAAARVELRSGPPHQHSRRRYDFQLCKGTSATASLFYSGQSGRPYTLTYSSGGRQRRQQGGQRHPVYLPTASDAAHLHQRHVSGPGRTFLNARRLHGGADRHRSCRATPAGRRGRTRSTAVSAFKLPTGKIRTEITLDMLNLINLFYAHERDLPVTRRSSRSSAVPGDRHERHS